MPIQGSGALADEPWSRHAGGRHVDSVGRSFEAGDQTLPISCVFAQEPDRPCAANRH